jgi:uncharacterized protein (TIGR03435 family)
MRRVWLFSVGAVVTIVTIITAEQDRRQSPTPSPLPSFAVASVKPNNSSDPRATTVPLQPNGRYAITNASLELLMQFAFQRPLYGIVGIPDWARREKFDIEARADGVPPAREIFLMLRSLLVERFNMVTHDETRPMPVYVLVALRSEQFGPQLRRHTNDSGCIDRLKTVAPGIPDPAKPLPTPVCGGWSGSPNLGRLTQS